MHPGETLRKNLRALGRDTRGLSTVEYVLLLIIIACMCMAAWKMFGATAATRTASASGDVGGLEQQSIDGPNRGGGGGTRVHSRVEDATADATPPPTTEEQLFEPIAFGGAALLLIIAMVVRRRGKKGGGGGDAPKK